MEEILKETLEEGEKVLWKGKVDSFETLDATNKNAIIRKAVLLIGIIGAFCIFYVCYALSKGIELKPVLVIVAMVCAVWGSLNYISESKKARRLTYVITNKRIMNILDSAKTLEFNMIDEVAFKTDADNHTSILFGKDAIESKAHQWRSLSLLNPFIEDETGLCSRFVMYAVEDADKAKETLQQCLPHLF